MRKKKKNLTNTANQQKPLVKRIINLKTLYALIVILLIILYPVYVSDGQKWTYVDSFGIKVPLRYTIHGIDVSHHNKKIDWHKVKNSNDNVGVTFCFIKATEGTDLKDQDFQNNWREAKKVGLIRGAYHFYVPWSDPVLQARNFINTVSLDGGDFVPVVDFEVQGLNKKVRQKLVANVTTFIEHLKSHYGVDPIIYTNKHIYRQYIKGNFDNYPLWISDYESRKLEGFDNSNLILWQHSTNGRLDGISGDVDFNVFVASKSHLDDICIK
ncbi:glycoside hydrolase family 25 protein [Emticicia sp. BO119]|uniref:glycoside hydrolase family 25 protein n=1 Tax=Emticicia sp. BO119 TaxID=2757768 RepID=UPI0015F10907|nr:GH25 family lysozyme [Emticicia sp. BO119]MBA4850063.1 glycoside hydrolase [Emticicia sp. BO119]